MVYALVDRAEPVVVLDNLCTGFRNQVAAKAEFVEGDVGDRALVRSLLDKYKIDAVVHFAGSVVVPESVEKPLKYYANNTMVSRALCETCIEAGVENFIFSSTAAVYGVPDVPFVDENSRQSPINPYGRSKLMTEWILMDAAQAHDFRPVVLRYFNVAGADPLGRTGQSTRQATHLIKRAVQVALGRRSHLDIFGTDFPTPDGTGVRDYIHVTDLVLAHLLALDALRAGAKSGIFNCGYGRGLSVREIVTAVERVAECRIACHEAPRRPGDPPMLVANSRRLQESLGWKPNHEDLDEMVRSALEWERRLPG